MARSENADLRVEVPALTNARRIEIATALQANGTPFRLRAHGDAWQSSDVELELQYGIELSEDDVSAIIALARQSGIAKPRRIWAGNTLGGGGRVTRVIVFGEPALDPIAKRQQTNFLRMVCPQWKALDGDRSPTKGGLPWQVDLDEETSGVPFWTESTRYYRHGLELWTYRASDAISEAVALDLFTAVVSRSVPWPSDGREPPRVNFDQHLGRILTREEVLDRAAFLVEEWLQEDWEYVVQLSFGGWSAASLVLHRDAHGWEIVGVRFAQA